jgi:hypothetical protein
LLDENGGDVDEAKALGEDFGKGDYEATRADDDEDVWVEQADNVEQDAVEAGQAVYERSDDEGMGTDDDEDEEDEEGSSDGEGGGGARSGFVDELVESSAKEFRALHRDVDKKRSRDQLADSGDLSDSASDAGSNNGDGAIARKKRARFADEGKAASEAGGADGAQAVADTSAAPPAAPAPADTTYDLSDDGVRRFITNVGGRVRIAEIREVFKQQCRAHGKAQGDKKAGANKLLDIIFRVTRNLEDPLMGTVLVLK